MATFGCFCSLHMDLDGDVPSLAVLYCSRQWSRFCSDHWKVFSNSDTSRMVLYGPGHF